MSDPFKNARWLTLIEGRGICATDAKGQVLFVMTEQGATAFLQRYPRVRHFDPESSYFYERVRYEHRPGCGIAVVENGKQVGGLSMPARFDDAREEFAWAMLANLIDEDHAQRHYLGLAQRIANEDNRWIVTAADIHVEIGRQLTGMLPLVTPHQPNLKFDAPLPRPMPLRGALGSVLEEMLGEDE